MIRHELTIFSSILLIAPKTFCILLILLILFFWHCYLIQLAIRTVKVRSVANEVIFCHLATCINKLSHDYTCSWYHRFLFIIKHDIAPLGESTQQSNVPGGSALRSNPLPFYTPFLTEKAGSPFIYVYWKRYPFHTPTTFITTFHSF